MLTLVDIAATQYIDFIMPKLLFVPILSNFLNKIPMTCTKVIWIHHLATMNVRTTFQGNPSNRR